MVASAASIVLTRKGNLPQGFPSLEGEHVVAGRSLPLAAEPVEAETFLQIPPFPGARAERFALSVGSEVDCSALCAALIHHRVGGTYWAAQPQLPDRYVVVTSSEAENAAREAFQDCEIVLWRSGACDPWHVLQRAAALVSGRNDELCLIAGLLEVPCYEFEGDLERLTPLSINLAAMVDQIASTAFEDPFTGEALNAIEAAELCGFWRNLIDSNRAIAGGLGFAFWKQDHVGRLLWNGSAPFRFIRGAEAVSPGKGVAVWRAKAPAEALAELERTGVPLIEVEDGFLRSRGLGADCVPPLSITVDRLGAHFDPAQPSQLELLLQEGGFDPGLLDRARQLRWLIVEAGMGKYECGTAKLDRPAGSRLHILVPGQVEDDRAVTAGGGGLTSNLELLRRVREQAPDAFILYKPHPDVLAGHRRGAIADAHCLRYADQIAGELPIASLIAMVDEVHVNTSLAGFEALLRDKKVTTYGVPFYAGWGLTHDLGTIPSRRSARRTLDEVVAATLLLYPRYLDPVTGLPCPAEVVVERLRAGEQSDGGMVVGMRRLQGKLMRRLRSLVQ